MTLLCWIFGHRWFRKYGFANFIWKDDGNLHRVEGDYLTHCLRCGQANPAEVK